MDWHDKDFQAHVCEVIGIDYKGLPLANHHKQRYLSLSLKNPSLQYPGPPARKANVIMNKPELPKDSAGTENALLGQYDREIASLNSKEEKYKKLLADLKVERASLTKKRNQIAKIVGQ